MRCADGVRVAIAWAAAVALAGCGGGNSSVTTVTGGGLDGGNGATVVALDSPNGPNTTEIVVDAGPAAGFSLGVANIPYVTVTVCAPGSATNCATIDHVFLDTGSVGLRLLKSKVAGLSLPAVSIAADPVLGRPGGRAVECYPFVLGAVWGPLVSADLRIAGEVATSLPVQVIDDATPMGDAAPAECIAAANGGLQNSVASLQANGILGIGMVAYDCGVNCRDGNYASGYTLYYACGGASGGACVPTAIPVALQVQNPVARFAVNNNGTVIAMPALPDLGAGSARGRLVFGIGTQANNQIPPTARMVFVDPDPTHADYLYFTTTTPRGTYSDSYIDSGSNALFFDDAAIAKGCQSSTASSSGWYCPAAVQRLTATVTDTFGASGNVDFAVANADVLFRTSSICFADLAGSAGQGTTAFVWGFPFFYGRTVFTSIWGQALSPNGPWNAF
jgi:hypothetical protein